jgi:hypothetical protein
MVMVGERFTARKEDIARSMSRRNPGSSSEAAYTVGWMRAPSDFPETS